MSFLDDVLFLMKENKWVDDINFINTSHEYLCIQDCFDIFTKDEKVLIKKDNDYYIVVFIQKDNKDINIIRIDFNENFILNNFFKRTRLLKIEEFFKNERVE